MTRKIFTLTKPLYCNEFQGLVDLYDRNQGGNGVGAWSTMASCDGFHGSSACTYLKPPCTIPAAVSKQLILTQTTFSLFYNCADPPLMDPYSKEQLGWGTFTELTTSQNKVTLSPSATHHQYIRITQGFPSGEYLLIENRQPIGFDKYIPAVSAHYTDIFLSILENANIISIFVVVEI